MTKPRWTSTCITSNCPDSISPDFSLPYTRFEDGRSWHVFTLSSLTSTAGGDVIVKAKQAEACSGFPCLRCEGNRPNFLP